MQYSIEGRVKNQNIVCGYINVLIHALKINRLKKHINVEFVTVCDGKALGYCWGDHDEVFIQISREYDGRRLGFLEMMQTLTHEMVHARQYFRKELINNNGDRVWKGVKVKEYDHKNAPWEKEAYLLEKTLFIENFPFVAEFKN
jgi:hypothetical protein